MKENNEIYDYKSTVSNPNANIPIDILNNIPIWYINNTYNNEWLVIEITDMTINLL